MALGVDLANVSVVFRHPKRGDVVAISSLDLSIRPGEFLTLLGASGCGKTTVLRVIAGFQRPTTGRVLIGGKDVTQIAANHREIGFVFQNYALFPHLSVFENVAYGLRVKRLRGDEIRERAMAGLHQVGLQGFGERSINEISGGQQQRVALARAIVMRPDVLLFDEPLSNLDAQLRVKMRGEIRRLQKELKITAIYVTHDQEEAMAISDRIAVMNVGRIVQIDTAEDLYLRPAARFVATFLGDANLVEGKIIASEADCLTLAFAGIRWDIATPRRYPVGSILSAVIRPEDISLSDTAGSLKGTVLSSTYLGAKIEYHVRLGDQILQVLQANPARSPRFSDGTEVGVLLPRADVHLLKDT